jgi:hypothetical protein
MEQNGSGRGYVEWHGGPLPKFFSELLGDFAMRYGGCVVMLLLDLGVQKNLEEMQCFRPWKSS